MKLYLIIISSFLFSCDSLKQDSKIKMKLDVEITPEGENDYTIAWYDTLGKSQNPGNFNKSFVIVCDILDKHDTAGSYHGLRVPSTWTSFGTSDSIITVYFSIARNPFRDLQYEKGMDISDISCNFLPVQLNTRSQLRQRIPLVLTEQ